jgi:hypothetical protein
MPAIPLDESMPRARSGMKYQIVSLAPSARACFRFSQVRLRRNCGKCAIIFLIGGRIRDC